MAWESLDRRTPVIEPNAPPVLSEAIRAKIRSFFPRYETKRAALLPALHVVQDALGHVSWQAMKEIAEVLEIPPAQVLDTISFYTHFWTHEKGRKVVVLCRSLSCQLLGADAVRQAIERQLKIGEHETTEDGAYSFVTEECLAACDHAPCLLINERLHKCVKPGDVPKLLADPNNDRVAMPRSELFDRPAGSAVESKGGA
ncbi:MAG: NAD(P)H-dependent oxidoreductase subunit E [Phycisphaerae bacterium]|nr:NAD(P)H-dependent oxidoreductase subunit E [Phycisphaerae bacterium]